MGAKHMTMYDPSAFLSIPSENRYLLLLTENYAALTAILSVLHDSDSEIEPYVLFGSGFPRDKEFTQVRMFSFIFLSRKNHVSMYLFTGVLQH